LLGTIIVIIVIIVVIVVIIIIIITGTNKTETDNIYSNSFFFLGILLYHTSFDEPSHSSIHLGSSSSQVGLVQSALEAGRASCGCHDCSIEFHSGVSSQGTTRQVGDIGMGTICEISHGQRCVIRMDYNVDE